MKCAVCNECYERIGYPGVCEYGGPFIGYAKVIYNGQRTQD